jgi:peroxiredoxin
MACSWGLVSASGPGLMACTPAPPEQAPDVRFTLLDGQPSSLNAWQGRVVLLNFWATTCGICLAELPILAAVRARHAARGFELLAVAVQWDPPARVAEFARQRAWPFPVVIDNTGEVAKALGDVKATPASLLLDRQGRIAKRWAGAVHEAELHARIEPLLVAAAGSAAIGVARTA